MSRSRAYGLVAALLVVACVSAAPRPARALSPLPEYLCYLRAGGLYRTLPHGQEQTIVVSSDIPTSVATKGFEPPFEVVDYSWAANGTRLAFLARSRKSGQRRLLACDQNGDGIVAVPESTQARSQVGGGGTSYAFTGDGKAVAFVGDSGIFCAAADGSASPEKLTPAELDRALLSDVCISPGDRYVGFVAETRGAPRRVWVAVRGTGTKYTSAVATDASRPAWQPYWHPSSSAGGGASGLTGAGSSGRFPCCPGPAVALTLPAAAALVLIRRRRRICPG